MNRAPVIDSITARTRSSFKRSARWRTPSASGGAAVFDELVGIIDRADIKPTSASLSFV